MVVCFNANKLVQVRISFGAHHGLLFLFEAISEITKAPFFVENHLGDDRNMQTVCYRISPDGA